MNGHRIRIRPGRAMHRDIRRFGAVLQEDTRYTLGMSNTRDTQGGTPHAAGPHIAAVVANLQLVADLGYGDVAVAVKRVDGRLEVLSDARPMTAPTTVASSRAGTVLEAGGESEAYEALGSGQVVTGVRRRITRGISYVTYAYPIGDDAEGPRAVVIRDLTLQILEAPGKMERQFMDVAEELLGVLAVRPFTDAAGEVFGTSRRAGDGLVRVDVEGRVAYASPNAVNIMRLAGVDGRVTGMAATRLPGGPLAIVPVLQDRAGRAAVTELEIAERFLDYRVMRVEHGALVLVEDRTDAHRSEQEIKVKEATIREIHHRVKNNLQTIASLLRIQARRTSSDEVRRALAEAIERVSSMAVVHDMLAVTTGGQIDFSAPARTVVGLVSRGLVGDDQDIAVSVEGDAGTVSDQVATSLALVLAELVHNAIEHGFADGGSGSVVVTMRRLPAEFVLTVRDDGQGLPPDFDVASSTNLGLAIVRTIVADDLKGTLAFGGVRGATVTVRIPLAESAPDAGEE